MPLTVVNNPSFDLPKTGGYGVWMYTVGGVLLLGAADVYKRQPLSPSGRKSFSLKTLHIPS